MIKLDTTQLDKIAAHLHQRAEDVCIALAFEGEAETKRLIEAWPAVDTGAYVNSVYTVTQTSDGYGSASSAVRNRNQDVDTAPHPKPTGKIIARWGPCVEYAGYIELGTSRMAARPSTVPAAETIARRLNSGQTWKELFR
jgi:hypothetical protein